MDLHVFEQLTHLCMGYHTLLNENRKLCLVGFDYTIGDTDCHPKRLVDIVPGSLKYIALNGGMSMVWAQAALAALLGLMTPRRQPLPILYYINTGGPAASNQHLISTFDFRRSWGNVDGGIGGGVKTLLGVAV
ncbi:hypothetical protein N7G274_008079 [Stereocaulon virgatum]|uniref:Uncharacterized protein n=1 Tax=Stereocaulon virgatum TaxID=373712 RepID=A0ABR4A1T9_9LECA